MLIQRVLIVALFFSVVCSASLQAHLLSFLLNG